ncbi:MAG: hypothetical protein NC332_05515 [Firmicutes bacterium]|nr:hypothetical protein [Bacillota bacterium]
MICKKGDKYAICIGLYDGDMEDFRKAVKIYTAQHNELLGRADATIGRRMITDKIKEILESNNND